MTKAIIPRAIPEEAKRRLRILFIAKHAKWESGLHPEDGNHALYHVETREILKGLGLDLGSPTASTSSTPAPTSTSSSRF